MAPPTKFAPTPQIGDALAAAKPEEPEVPGYGGFASPPSETHLVAPAPLVPEPTGIPFPGHAAMPGVPLGGPGGVASKRMAALAPAGPQGQVTPAGNLMPGTSASPVADALEGLGNIPTALGQAGMAGASDFASQVWQAPGRIVPTAMQAIGVAPGVPSPDTKLDVLAQRGEQFGKDVSQLPEVRSLEQGPGVSGVVGRGLTSDLRVAPLAVGGPVAAGLYGASSGTEESEPKEGESPQLSALRAAGHGAIDAAAMTALPSIIKGATPGLVQAAQGAPGAIARTIASSAEFGGVVGAQAAANTFLDTGDVSQAIKAGAEAAKSGVVTGAMLGVAHLRGAKTAEAQETPVSPEAPKAPKAPELPEPPTPEQLTRAQEATRAEVQVRPVPPAAGQAPDANAPGPERGNEAAGDTHAVREERPAEVRAPAVDEAAGRVEAPAAGHDVQGEGPDNVQAPEPARGPEGATDAAAAAAADRAGGEGEPGPRAEPNREVPPGVEAGLPDGMSDRRTGPQWAATGEDVRYQNERRVPGSHWLDTHPDTPLEPNLNIAPPERGVPETTGVPHDAEQTPPPPVEPGAAELAHLEAVRAARQKYEDAGPGEPGMHAAYGIEETKAEMAHQDATREPGAPRNRRDLAKDLVDNGRPPEEAEHQADVADALVQRLAKESGQSPDDLYKTIGIGKNGDVEQGGERLNQMAPTEAGYERPARLRPNPAETPPGHLRVFHPSPES